MAEAFGRLAGRLQPNADSAGASTTLQWPSSRSGLALMTTMHLAQPTAWQPVTNAEQDTGTPFSLTLPWQPRLARFYRLQSN